MEAGSPVREVGTVEAVVARHIVPGIRRILLEIRWWGRYGLNKEMGKGRTRKSLSEEDEKKVFYVEQILQEEV